MNDELAISLFVKDGGMAHEWHAVDQVVRNHYEKLALEKGRRDGLRTTFATSELRGFSTPPVR